MGYFNFTIALLLLISCITGISAQKPECPKIGSDNDNVTLTVTAAMIKPYLHYNRAGCYIGFVPQMFTKISKITGFNFEIKKSEEGVVGTKQADGTWSGMMGEITRKEANIAAGPIAVTSARMRVIDFSSPFMESGIIILYKRQPPWGEVPFNCIKSLLASGISIGSIRDGTVGDYLKHSVFPDVQKLYTEITSQGNWYDSLKVALGRVSRGNFALIIERDLAVYVAKRKPCNVMIVGEPLADIDYAFALPLGQPHKHRLDLAVQELRENGEFKKMKEKIWGAQECTEYPVHWEDSKIASQAASLHLPGLAFTVLIYLLGNYF